jgi:hypothetical protein
LGRASLCFIQRSSSHSGYRFLLFRAEENS